MKEKILPIVFFLLVAGCFFSQSFSQISGCIDRSKTQNIWYFGDSAGLDFNTGTPVALTDGSLYSYEGSAAISDINGKLLFYTNGEKVWNSAHKVMLNGGGLMGHQSSTQSSIIIPKPGSTSNYYIFTTDAAENSFRNGLKYSEIDMTLDNGYGGIISGRKNILLYAPATEGLTATYHQNGCDVWIISHDLENNYIVYYLSSTGISNNSIVSNIGTKGPCIGQLKVSPNGKKLARVVNRMVDGIDPVEWSDFDNLTGIVSNLFKYELPTPCGVEFSPDSKLLYISGNRTLYQFNLSNNSNNLTLVAADYLGSLQLGPDGKIYTSGHHEIGLSVINNPNINGIGCDLLENKINLNGKMSNLGLPNVFNGIQGNLIDADFTFLSNCLEANFNPTSIENSIYSWDFGDPISGNKNISNASNPIHQYSYEGNYLVTLRIEKGCQCRTITKNIAIEKCDIPAPCIDHSKINNTWYFGNDAGNIPHVGNSQTPALDFNGSTAVSINENTLWTFGGVASVSDDGGKMLFYTNGTKVWNKNHELMPHGNGLLADTSTTQGAIIIPKPGSPTNYYLFTTLVYGDGSPGLRYSELDKSLDQGKGDIIADKKNILLYTSPISNLTAIPHSNGCDFWIISHEMNSQVFKVFLVSSTGISSPVSFPLGRIYNRNDNNLELNIIPNYMKASHDGKTIALTVSGVNKVDLLTFDSNTGLLSNYREASLSFNFSLPHGVEFSSNDQLLYVGTWDSHDLYQIDLSTNLDFTLLYSEAGLGALQVGPDKKIYVAIKSNYIAVINNPDVKGTGCNFVEKTIAILPSDKYNWGYGSLPNFYKQTSVNVDFTFTNNCNKVNFISTTSLQGLIYNWDFGDPSSSDKNISHDPNPAHIYASSGTYIVTLNIQNGCSCKTITKTITITVQKPDFVYESPCINTPVKFTNNSTGGTAWLWQFGDGDTSTSINISHIFPNQGTYVVHLISNPYSACADTASQTLTIAGTIDANFSSTIGCIGTAVNFTDASTATSDIKVWQWNFGDGRTSTEKNAVHLYKESGNYQVELNIQSQEGCIDTTVYVVIIKEDSINPAGTHTFCANETSHGIALQGFVQNVTQGVWTTKGTGNFTSNTDPNNSTYFPSEIDVNSGSVQLTLKNTGNGVCNDISNIITINFKAVPVPPNENIVFCKEEKKNVILNAGVASRYVWIGSGNTLREETVMDTGTYYVKIYNEEGCEATGKFLVSSICAPRFFVPNAFTPNNDHLNDSLALFYSFVKDFELIIFNPWGEIIYKVKDFAKGDISNNKGHNIWDGKYKGEDSPIDEYPYILKYNSPLSVDPENPRTLKGTITIVR